MNSFFLSTSDIVGLSLYLCLTVRLSVFNYCLQAVKIEDIYFLEMNTKYISSSVLKTSEFSRVCSTSENSYVFNSRDEIYLVFTEKSRCSYYFIILISYM